MRETSKVKKGDVGDANTKQQGVDYRPPRRFGPCKRPRAEGDQRKDGDYFRDADGSQRNECNRFRKRVGETEARWVEMLVIVVADSGRTKDQVGTRGFRSADRLAQGSDPRDRGVDSRTGQKYGGSRT